MEIIGLIFNFCKFMRIQRIFNYFYKYLLRTFLKIHYGLYKLFFVGRLHEQGHNNLKILNQLLQILMFGQFNQIYSLNLYTFLMLLLKIFPYLKQNIL
jgi:hypothetical protein